MALQGTPDLIKFIDEQPDKVGAIAHFMVDNNPEAIFTVLRANGYTFNTPGEASIILRSILVGTSAKQKSELAQISKIPYNNNNTNGTGGLKGEIGGTSISGAGDDLLCSVSSLFSFPIGCPPPGATPEQIEAQRKEAEAAAAKARTTNYIIIGVIVVIVIIAFGYFYNKNKKKSKES